MKKVYVSSTGDYTEENSRYTVISLNEALNIVNSDLVIIIDGNNKIESYEAFKLMYKVVSNKNSVYIIGAGLEDEYAKNVFCLAMVKSLYNLYRVDSIEDVDSEYLDSIVGKQNTLKDVENYISEDVVFPEVIGEILLEIIDKCDDDDEALLQYIKSKTDIIKNSVYYNECMRCLHDKLTAEIYALREENDNMSKEYGEMKRSTQEKMDRIANLEGNIAEYKRDISALKQENESIVAQLNRSGPIVSNFQQIHTGTLPRSRTKNILYFKEISYVRYANSLIVNMLKMLGYTQAGLKVRLLVFDNKNDFSIVYKPLPIVTLQDYLRNKDRLLSLDAMVVVEPNHVIVEDILKMDHDLLIIYDRLKLSKDIVHGNDVFKYWVINSKRNYESIKGDIKDTKYVITRPGVLNECIAIPEIEGYSGISDSAKIYKYRALVNACPQPQGLIVENILKRAGIDLPRRR